MRAAARTVALAAVLLGAAAAPAGATIVRATENRFEVIGGPGQVNTVFVRYDLEQQVVTVSDRVPLDIRVDGGGPCANTEMHHVECPFPTGTGPRRFVIDLGDRDDRLTIEADRASPEAYAAAGLNTEVRDGPGNDRVFSVPTLTRMVNGPGNDVLRGAAVVTPGGGNDEIGGTAGPDKLDGGPGRDVIRGGDGADVIRGGTGNDRLFGQRGADRIFGGAGNDFLRGGAARDALFGGPGTNTLIQG